MYHWFQNNLDVIFFIYGLTILIMGLIILIQPKKDSQFKLANIFWLLVAYALIHSPSDFISMWDITKGRYELLYEFGSILTYISYLFLFEFGRRLFGLSSIRIPWWILPLLVLITLLICLFSQDFWVTLNILFGYFIRFPAGVMAGLGFRSYYYINQEKLESFQVKKYFIWTGIALLAWALFCGLVRARGDFFPANLLNTESFFSVVHIPIYVFRSVNALIVAAGITGILKIFNIEGRKKIEESLKRERQAILGHEKDLAKIQTRDRIARNLHDEIGATISGITHFAESIGKDQKFKGSSKSKKLLSLIVESSSEAQEKIKDLIWTVNPENDNWDLLLAKFRRYASDLFDSKEIRYEIDFPERVSFIPLNMEQRQNLWLIFKEIINNIVKHAQCNQVEISIQPADDVRLKVIDDGVGFDPKKTTKGMGIKNIRTRAKKLNAQLNLQTTPGKGTQWDMEFDV